MIVLGQPRFERPYEGYLIEGSAEPVSPGTNLLFATATVLLKSLTFRFLRVDRFQDRLLAYADLAPWFGSGIMGEVAERLIPRGTVQLDKREPGARLRLRSVEREGFVIMNGGRQSRPCTSRFQCCSASSLPLNVVPCRRWTWRIVRRPRMHAKP